METLSVDLSAPVPLLLALTLAPLLLGIINRTKAWFAGRRGAPVLQAYHDLFKLLRKGAVYSRTTTWVFRAGPLVGLAAVVTAAALAPFGGRPALLSFSGDLILFAYLLGLMRFATMLAALDTGSAFEGMGASREAQFSALAEPALLLGFAALARDSGAASLTGIFAHLAAGDWLGLSAIPALVAVAFMIVYLTENARIPVDDPNTHLELTMIHEVMVLDHGGPDFGVILYGVALKLWLLGSLLTGLLLPAGLGHWALDLAAALAGMLALAVATGVIESCMARLRLLRVPQLLVGASAFAVLALVLAFRQVQSAGVHP
jgi:formate hydrogenlyase subunit 4